MRFDIGASFHAIGVRSVTEKKQNGDIAPASWLQPTASGWHRYLPPDSGGGFQVGDLFATKPAGR
jgi:hypothetical protein